MDINELTEKTIELKLIEHLDNIDFLFLNLPSINNSLTLNENIQSALKWAYDNDELDDFFGEHYETFIQFDEPVIGCQMLLASSIRTETYFDLYQFQSKNKYYFKVIGRGEYADSWDWKYGFFDVVDKNAKQDVISNFKDTCREVFIIDGEFDYDELIKDGHQLLFT